MYLRAPKRLHLELSSYCNAACPMCPRELKKYQYAETQLKYKNVVKTFEGYLFDEVKHGGNLGDPMMCKDALKIFKFFEPMRQLIHTNGSLRNTKFWSDIGKIEGLVVVFGIDGINQESHSRYRVNTNYTKIMENVKAFIESGGEAWWQFIVFKHNEHELQEAKQVARDMGFANFDTVYTRRFATLSNDNLSPPESQPLFIVEEKKVECKSQRLEEIYVSATGEVFACDYLANHYSSHLNIHDMSFDSIIHDESFDKLLNDIHHNPCETCRINCGMKYSNMHVLEEL